MLSKYIPQAGTLSKEHTAKSVFRHVRDVLTLPLQPNHNHVWDTSRPILPKLLSILPKEEVYKISCLEEMLYTQTEYETVKITSDLEVFSCDDFYLPEMPSSTLWVDTSDLSDTVCGVFFGSPHMMRTEVEKWFRVSQSTALMVIDESDPFFQMTDKMFKRVLDDVLSSTHLLIISKNHDGKFVSTNIPFVNYSIATDKPLSEVFQAGVYGWLPEDLAEEFYGVFSVVCDVLRRIDQGEFIEDREVVVREITLPKVRGKKQKRKKRVKRVEETVLRYRHKDSLPREVTRSVTEGTPEFGGERKPYEGTSHYREVWVTEEYASRHDLDLIDIEERTKTYKSGEATKTWCKVRLFYDYGRENTKPVVKKYRV